MYGDKKTKDEVTGNSVQVLHSTLGTINVNLYQFKVSGNEIEYDKTIRKQLQTRPNVTLSNEEYHLLSNKFVVKQPELSRSISNLISRLK